MSPSGRMVEIISVVEMHQAVQAPALVERCPDDRRETVVTTREMSAFCCSHVFN